MLLTKEFMTCLAGEHQLVTRAEGFAKMQPDSIVFIREVNEETDATCLVARDNNAVLCATHLKKPVQRIWSQTLKREQLLFAIGDDELEASFAKLRRNTTKDIYIAKPVMMRTDPVLMGWEINKITDI